jgi:transglutaminase-like putative cysteine protease
MNRLLLRHETTYRYAKPVTFGDHRLMFRPRDSHDLRLVETALEISPAASVRWYHDVLGNSIAIASFTEPAAELKFVSTIRLEHYPTPPREIVIEPYARVYPFSYSSDEIPDLGRTVERHYPDPDHVVDDWARRFVAKEGQTDTLAMLTAMTHAIRDELTYTYRCEEGTQPPVETLAKGGGSCRDYALLMMEAVRSLGFAARFVSGYLAQTDATGAGETHAWAQVYLPGAGWTEFDPTNGIVGGEKLIRVAVARDPSGAVPLSGTFVGAPADFLGMSVAVEIREDSGGAATAPESSTAPGEQAALQPTPAQVPAGPDAPPTSEAAPVPPAVPPKLAAAG